MNTGIILGIHTSFDKGIFKYGSVKKMPQYPVFSRFSREGNVTVFTMDSKDYTDSLPKNVTHFRIYNKLLFVIASWLIISIISRRNEIDYLYYQSGSSLFSLPFANSLSGARTILYYGVMLHVNQHSKILRPLYYWFEKISMKWVDYVISCSTEIDEFILEKSWFRGRFISIKKFIRMKKPNPKIKHDMKQVVWVGRMDDVKDPISMIAVWIGIALNHKDAQLIMCGDGSQYKYVKIMAKAFNHVAKKHGIRSDTLITPGQVHNIPERLQRAGILVSTSKYEGSPDNIIEGMGMGLPVIATDVGGTSNFVRNNWTGFLIRRDCDDCWLREFASAIMWMLKNPVMASHMGKQAQVIAWKNYDMKKALNKLVGLMKSNLFFCEDCGRSYTAKQHTCPNCLSGNTNYYQRVNRYGEV